MILMFAGIAVVNDIDPPAHLETIALAILELALIGFGLGMTNAAIEQAFPTWREIYGVISRPLMLICAVFCTLESLPASARDILAYIPMTHGIGSFRFGYYSGYRSSVLDVGYLYEVALTLCLVGFAAERTSRVATSAER
jgi:capsular polysaccharide transport system permease protein